MDDMLEQILAESAANGSMTTSSKKSATTKSKSVKNSSKKVNNNKQVTAKVNTVIAEVDLDTLLLETEQDDLLGMRSPKHEELSPIIEIQTPQKVYSGLLKTLSDMGYEPQAIIEYGRKTRYIQATSMYGQMILIEADQPTTGGTSITTNYIKSEKSLVPYSTVKGLIQCLDLGIAGIAFESSNRTSISIIMHADESQLTLIIKGSEPDTLFSVYPVVRLEDVLAFPEDVSQNVDNACKQIAHINWTFDQQTMETLVSTMQEIGELVERYSIAYTRANEEIHASLDKLFRLNVDYGDSKTLTDDESKKLKLLRLNQQKRYEILDQIMFSSRSIDNQIAPIISVRNLLEDGIKYLNEKVENCNTVLYD